MSKQKLEQELSRLNKTITDVNVKKDQEIREQLSERVTPLLDEAEKIKAEINTTATNKYADELAALLKNKTELVNQINDYKISEAKELWYPEGTKVYLWKLGGSPYSKDRQWEKEGKTGVVAVYDGSQDLSSISRYNRPKKGDIIVLHHKKDGSVGLKFDHISDYGSIKSYKPKWYAEGDTPTDNIETRKEAKEEETENKF